MKVFIILVIAFFCFEILCDIFLDLYYRWYFKQIDKMSPEEKYLLQKEILEQARQKAYQQKQYQIVDKISDLLEEKYND